MNKFDCLLIGHSNGNLERSIKLRELAFGKKSAAYQDLDQAFITVNNKPYSPLDYLNKINADKLVKKLSNTDFIWPAVMVIGSYLKQHGLTFDYVNDGDDKESIANKLHNNIYTCVGITTTLYVESEPIIKLIELIRSINNKLIIVVGGPFINSSVKGVNLSRVNTLLKQLRADIYVNSGEGQHTLVNIINALKNNGDLRAIKNIIYKNPDLTNTKEYFIHNETEIEYNDIVEFRNNYDLFFNDINGFISLSTAKSCPYACSYCTFPQRAGKYTYFPVDEVEKELNRLRELGVHTLTFLDDTFNVPRNRFKDILKMMIKNEYGFKWNSFFRADQSDEETIELMAKSGCEGVFIGMESASDLQLKNMNKTSQRKHYEMAIPKFKEYNILTHVNYIIGFPGETKETVQQTIDFVKEYKPDLYKAQIWYCERLSPIWKQKEKFNIEGEGFEWSHNTMNSVEAMHLLDDFVNQITESVYNREEGLGLWSFFYLQRKGFELSNIKSYVNNFYKIANYQRLNNTNAIPDNLFEDMCKHGRV